jgi:hypothetical protein
MLNKIQLRYILEQVQEGNINGENEILNRLEELLEFYLMEEVI